ncbi:ankyrin repeat domain-containing protein [Anatilimnocola floriformis]|uniref:ankyrin repeat domain-containing protein n=1 Tax=Anatilimnocola floriformis TaxID=2948575 RepID=UPI0020C1C202|nr:hypothetical protein [Anatilimnocola floriformis]
MDKLLICTILVTTSACARMENQQATTPREAFHEKYQWNAEDYFTDPKVIRLCHAIEADDIAMIERLVADGADINAQGKGRMTPLMWSFPGRKLGRFCRLLELGANPNVFFESDFNTKGHGFLAGESVTELAASSHFPRYFDFVMNHGGNPKLINPVTKNGLLIAMLRSGVPDVVDRIQLYAGKGGDLNQKSSDGCPAIMEAAKYFGQFRAVLRLMDLGANPKAYWEDENKKLAHMVVTFRNEADSLSEEAKSDLTELERRLTNVGESLDEAAADKKRWRSWDWPSGVGRKLMAAEVAERHSREAAAQAKAKE